MTYLLDTGIILRLRLLSDPQHLPVRNAVRMLRSQRHRLVTTAQNAGEFWNVSTRPLTARGGYGLSVVETDRKLRLVERLFPILPDTAAAYPIWRELVVRHSVLGVQVHDARLAAMMRVYGVTHLLTLNASDFARYDHVTAVTPQQVLAAPSA